MTKKFGYLSAVFACSFAILSGCSKISSRAPTAPSPAAAQLSARAEFDRATAAVQKTPNFETFTQLGLAQLNVGDPAAAVRSFEQTTRIDPKSAIAFNNVCAAYNGMGKWTQAMEACKKALSLAPDMQLAKNNLAFAIDSQKRIAARIAELETKAQTSTDADLLLQLGMEYYNQGEYRRAIAVWKRAPRDAKVAPTIQNNIASAAILVKEFSLAKQAIEEALAADPKNQLFLNNRTWLLQAQKEAAAH